MHADEIQSNRGHRRICRAVQGMPDIAALAEQTEKVPLVLRELAPEQRLKLILIDDSEPDAPRERRVDAGIGDETPAFGAGIRRRGTRRADVAEQIPAAVVMERLQLACELQDRPFHV